MRLVTVKIDEVLLAEVERLAKELGVTRSEVIRRALQRYIKDFRSGEVRPAGITYKKIVVY